VRGVCCPRRGLALQLPASASSATAVSLCSRLLGRKARDDRQLLSRIPLLSNPRAELFNLGNIWAFAAPETPLAGHERSIVVKEGFGAPAAL
jgi:hypothetical protein